MALENDRIYAIRNDLTHTVLDLGNIRGLFGMHKLSRLYRADLSISLVKSCGWHGGPNQQVRDKTFSTGWHMLMCSTQWQAIAVGGVGPNMWKFRNQFENQHSPRRFLYPQPADGQIDGHFRLTGGLGSCDFEVVQIQGAAHRWCFLTVCVISNRLLTR
jgi:hypothetical protein